MLDLMSPAVTSNTTNLLQVALACFRIVCKGGDQLVTASESLQSTLTVRLVSVGFASWVAASRVCSCSSPQQRLTTCIGEPSDGTLEFAANSDDIGEFPEGPVEREKPVMQPLHPLPRKRGPVYPEPYKDKTMATSKPVTPFPTQDSWCSAVDIQKMWT